MKNKNRLEEFISSPKKSLWKLSVPMMLGMSVQAIYMLIDTAFIGNWVGFKALTGLGFVFPPMFIIMGITFGIGSGATTVIAQNIGRDDKKNADNAAEHLLALGIGLSIFFILIGYFSGTNILKFQGATGQSLVYASSYFFIMLIGIPFMIFSIFFRSILSGEGDNMLPMKILGLGTIINIVLDPILIYYYQIEGAAIATVISQCTVFVLFIYIILIKETSFISFNLKKFKWDRKILSSILKIGLPVGFSMLIMAIGIFFYNSILSKSLHPDSAIAAYTTAHRIEHLFFIPLISIATSMVTLIGMFYGAKKFNLIKIIIIYCIKSCLLISLLYGLIFYFLADQIIPIFVNANESPQVISFGVSYFKIFAFAVPFICLGMIGGRVMQGLGKSYPMFILTCLRVIIISCSLAWYFIEKLNMPLEFAWIAILISCISSSIISIIWMLFVIKKTKLKRS